MLFNFEELFATFYMEIKVYRNPVGYRDYSNGGQWIESLPADGIKPKRISGIVVPLSNEDLQFDQSGTYTQEDRKVYLRIPDILDKGDEVEFKGKRYRVMRKRDYQEVYADFNMYICQRSDIARQRGVTSEAETNS